MQRRYSLISAAVFVATSLLAGGATDRTLPRDLTSRAFHFEYTVTVADISADSEELRIWLPVPQSDENQEVSNLSVVSDPPIALRFASEPVYGNSYVFLHEQGDLPAEITITLSFDATRHETQTLRTLGFDATEQLLTGDSLAPITEEVTVRATAAIAGADSCTEQAHGIYTAVLADMTYDKSGEGWGRGDIYHACDVGAGNCSDFHTLFIGMSRAVEIPAYFEIGFPLPPDQTEGTIGGYHCWAWFEGEDGTWRPVDISEADKHPDQAAYFFGTVCCNRIAFTRGRDLELSPPPASGPVNFFIYPIVEIDGGTATNVTKRFTFENLRD